MISAIWDNLKGLYSLLVGMCVTARYFFSPQKTIHYPRKTVDPEDLAAYRGPLELTRGKDDESRTRCISCQMCAKGCPGNCITVVKGTEGKLPSKWLYDFSLCCLCGACVEVCPASAIDFSHRLYLVTTSREELVMDLLKELRERVAARPLKPPRAGGEAGAGAKPAAEAKPAADSAGEKGEG
ncbi:MAG: 4Fe-4S dicluster domain-containing protein [Deltaproteobacteria bacterium]|jgi:NADH-quinone oxidoreductase subunit I|nr:4Fe-4S dicluster domain-containing protein [Deltaproteobacteria bacterium]